LRNVPLDTFYRAINKVERSLIRTDADEVTYNLHVMLRFTLEIEMLEGRLRIKDLPEAWRDGMRADLGIAPPDDRDGCLQDVHWYVGGIGGAFHSYTIGNILAAQFHAAAVKAHPDIPREIARGAFATLHGWLTENIYRHGRKFTPDEIVERATGSPMRMEPFLAYLRGKYGELYRLPAWGPPGFRGDGRGFKLPPTKPFGARRTPMPGGLRFSGAVVFATVVAASLSATPAQSQSLEEFYRGKTVSIVLFTTPGSIYDTYARLLARFLPRHLPGQPTVVVRNMSG